MTIKLKFIKKLLQNLFKVFFSKKTILLVTNGGIKNININFFGQLSIYIAISWLFYNLNQSFSHQEIINAKNTEIKKLKSINRFFENELGSLNEEFNKISEYIKITPNLKHLVSLKQSEIKDVAFPLSINKQDISNYNPRNLEHLIKIKHNSQKINNYTRNRIDHLQKIINIAGLNATKLPKKDFLNKIFYFNNKDVNSFEFQGGPLQESKEIDIEVINKSSKYDINRSIEKINFKNKIDRLIYLENVINSLPLQRPMKNYYISSSFGYRKDPITKKTAMHKGQDFAGPLNEKIISPSKGKVILAGNFSQYGKAIVIDHGFGITTRYGHLSKINVKKGQIINAGQVIGVQGNSGRSTGHHLHYEVRYKNKALNPRKFIKAGDNLFQNLYIES
jgi:murein DD-endopeptidase MepM/ murein hydrolase activator NlpD